MKHERNRPRALSARERQRVQDNMGLVAMALQRRRHLVRPGHPGSDPAELFQVGCMALIDAVMTHRPRHGSFAAFAMARIHFAVSRHVHESASPIRVPFISQRRSKAKSPMPVVPRVTSIQRVEGRIVDRSLTAEERRRHEILGDCYRRAAARAINELFAGVPATSDRHRLIERCLLERWSIPDPECRTPLRTLARSLGCSVGRVVHCERRFKQKVAANFVKPCAVATGRAAQRRRPGC